MKTKIKTCDKCGGKTKCWNSRPYETYIYRQRKCLDCGYKYGTREVIWDDYQYFIKAAEFYKSFDRLSEDQKKASIALVNTFFNLRDK